MTKTKIDSLPGKELRIEQLQTSLEKEKKTSGKNVTELENDKTGKKYSNLKSINLKLETKIENN